MIGEKGIFQQPPSAIDEIFLNNQHALHSVEGFSWITKSSIVKDPLSNAGIDLFKLDQSKLLKHTKVQIGLFRVIGDLADRFYSGGYYYKPKNIPLASLGSSFTAITLSYEFIKNICGEDLKDHIVYYIDGMNWNNWFRSDWCSVTY